MGILPKHDLLRGEKMNLAILILINIACFGIGYVLGKFKQ